MRAGRYNVSNDMSAKEVIAVADYKDYSVPLPGGGDTRVHPFGPGEKDFTITTQLPRDIKIHDNPFDPGNVNTNNIRPGDIPPDTIRKL